MRSRFHIVFSLLSMGFLCVTARLAFLQLWCHDDLSRRVIQQSQPWVAEAPRRAPILDRHGAVLVESIRVATCYADPTMIRRPGDTALRLGPALGLSPSSVLKKIRETPGSYVLLKKNIPVEEAHAVERLNLLGVGLRWEYRRSYPNGDLASSLLGFVGEDGRGLSGLEYVFDRDLWDPRPARRVVRDGRGNRFIEGGGEKDTGGLRLTIDRTLQYIAERELEAGVKRSRARAGFIVVQDPATGEILALASRPALTFDAGRPPTAEELAVWGVQWVFEPGSTFKIVTAAAALEEGVVNPREMVNCESGKWKVASLTINDHEPEKVISFARAMEVSSNIALAKMGLRLGSEKFYDYIRAFGFGARAGVDLSGEGAGLLRPLRQWSGASLPVVSFGQEVGVTGIQLAGAYSALANGGTLLEPRICLELTRPDGTVRTWPTAVPVRRVVSSETTAQVTRMLEGVVTEGTGRNAELPGWTAAGKTGTAQKIDARTKGYSSDKYVASFCGFAPSDRPRLTAIVVIDEPKGVSWGGYNAGPIFRNVMWQGLVKMGVPPNRTPQVAQSKTKGVRRT